MIKWTEKEIETLKQLYPDDSNSQQELCDKFERNWEAIKGVAKRYGLKRGNKTETKSWTSGDIELIKSTYPDSSLSSYEISQKMGRTWSSIANMAHRLQLSRENPNCWSQENIEKLKRLYEDLTVSKQQLQEEFPNQSLQSIYTKAWEMNLNRLWTEEEIEKLKKIYELKETTDESLLEALPGRSHYGIHYKASGLGLKRYREWNPLFWTEEDNNKLIEVFSDTTKNHKELEQIFDRSWEAIRKRAFKMNLKRIEPDTPEKQQYRKEKGMRAMAAKGENKKWTDEEVEYLKSAYYKMDQEEVCSKLDRSWAAIKGKAKSLDLTRRRKNYDVNSTYFDTIDTNEKAYLLGFIMSDGNVNGIGCLKLDIHKKDIKILEMFKKEIAPEFEIKYPKNRPTIVTFQINDVYLCKSLEKYGVVPNKSDIITWPTKLSEEFAIPFIIGYFDGDGTLCIIKEHNKWHWGVLGCYDLLSNMKKYVEKYTGISIPDPVLSGNHFPTYKISKTGTEIEKIDKLFCSYDIGLERKRMEGYVKWNNITDIPRTSSG